MNKFMKNLTKDQKRFAVIGLISVIAVFVALFFIRGLSGLQYSAPKNEKAKTNKLEAAMVRAVEMEYETYALYSAATDKFADAEPFLSITANESFNIGNLITVFDTYGFELPENKYIKKDVKLADTMQEVCEAALALEVKHAKVYESVDLDILGYVDVEAALGAFAISAKNNYIPSLTACIAAE